jgi:isopenicillin N synthase-like dioxygenase
MFGFVILQNHGVSHDLIARSQECSKKFFALSAEEKMRYHQANGGARGGGCTAVECSWHAALESAWFQPLNL